MDDEAELDRDTLIASVIASAEQIAVAGEITKSALAGVIDGADLPARYYGAAVAQVVSSGLTLIEDPDAEPDDDDPRAVYIDGLGLFMRRSAHRVLSMGEEQALGVRMDRGALAAAAIAERGEDLLPDARRDLARIASDGQAAAEDLAAHNIRLVISIANKLRGYCSPALEFEDLIQEGYFGLARAIEDWDHTRRLKFSTYATWWIRQTIDRAIANKASSIRLPVHARDSLRTIVIAEREMRVQGETVTHRALAAKVGLPVGKVSELLGWRNRIDSLDRLVGNSTTSLGSLITDRGSSEPESQAELESLRVAIEDVLSELTDRERHIMRLRYGLSDGQERTLEEVGKEFGVTRERIRQIESKALAKMRHPHRSRKLREYLEV